MRLEEMRWAARENDDRLEETRKGLSAPWLFGAWCGGGEGGGDDVGDGGDVVDLTADVGDVTARAGTTMQGKRMAQPTWTASSSASESASASARGAAASRGGPAWASYCWTWAWAWASSVGCDCDSAGLHCAWKLAMSSSRSAFPGCRVGEVRLPS